MNILSEYLNEELPREKLSKYGPEKLTDVELLAIILRTGTKGRNVLELSRDILKLNSKESLSRKSLSEMKQIKGLKDAKASQVCALFELSRRLAKTSKNINTKSLKNSERVYEEVKIDFKHLDIERVMIVYVNSKNKILKKEFVFEGGFDTSMIDLRIIIKKVLNESATGFFIIHNHPSGDSTPSNNDILTTHQLKEACNNLNIHFLDHIIIGDNYFSFADEGII